MRILVVNWRDIKHPEAGGAELYIHNICVNIVKRGHQVEMFSAMFSSARDTEEIDGIHIIRFGGRLSVYFLAVNHYLKRKNNYDIIIESINTIPFCIKLYSSIPVIPIIYSINNAKALINELGVTPISVLALIFNSLITRVYRHSIALTITSSGKKDIINAGFNPNNVFVAEPSFSNDFEESVQSFKKVSNRPNFNIVYLGRLKKYKCISVILQAISILSKKYPINLIIIGQGDYAPELRRQVKALGLEDHVKFTGFVTEQEKVALLAESSVFVCCSIDEGGWTIAGLEAMRCGVPLVITDSQKDLIEHGVTGYITPREPDIVAQKILDVLLGDWKKMSTLSIKRSEDVTWERAADNVLIALNAAIIKYNTAEN